MFWLFPSQWYVCSLWSPARGFQVWCLDVWCCCSAVLAVPEWCRPWRILHIEYATALDLVKDTIADVVPQVSSFHQVEHEVEGVSVLEGEVHVHDEGRVDLGQQHALIHHTLHTLLCHDTASAYNYMDFSISFIANWFLVFLCSTFQTFPKPPFPMMKV